MEQIAPQRQAFLEIVDQACLLREDYRETTEKWRQAREALLFIQRTVGGDALTAPDGSLLSDAIKQYQIWDDSCAMWESHRRKLRDLVRTHLPDLYPRLPLVASIRPWHGIEDFDWVAAEEELRRVEAEASARAAAGSGPARSAAVNNPEPEAAGAANGKMGQGDRSDSDLDRKFMERAIEEARKSSDEDGRVHPKVGVVIVMDGRELAAAYRGELGSGNHAEFTALEKKLADHAVASATVYTTLEPCTTRSHPKVPCAIRLIERKVKRVVIGMLDPNPRVSGKGVQKLREANIVVDLFHSDPMSKIEEMNREFIRYHKNAAEPEGRFTTIDDHLL